MRLWAQYEFGTRPKEIYFRKSKVVKASYLIHYDTILQNATDVITKCDSCYEMQRLLQNASVQSAKGIYEIYQLIGNFSSK